MQFWSIGDIARQTNVPASTIRYYEEIQLLPPAERVNGRRRYDHTILPQLTLIRLAQQAGFTIAEIQTLLHDFPAEATPSARWQVMAQQKLNELDERLKVIAAMKAILVQTLACQCETLAECGVGIADDTAVAVNC